MAGARNGVKAIFITEDSPNIPIYSYSCTDALALSRGTLVEISDPYTVSMANAWTTSGTTANGCFAGIVSRDKEANDGSTTVAIQRNFRADVRCSGAVTMGTVVYCAGNDEVRNLPVTLNATVSNATVAPYLIGMAVGIAEETGSDGEVIVIRSLY